MRIFANSNAARHCTKTKIIVAFVMALCTCHSPSQTNEIIPPPSALKKLSLEELMDIEVTSVSKRPEKLSETASAIQVVTGEDIHRSGVSSLPEALRLAANLQVAQVNSHDWAISARGFNNTLANKLLVMIDGRTIYTPLYAGVFWDVQNLLLEDVDRIEVVSGPGGTLWGANAVNGVINIVTKSARDTQGLLVTAGGGSLLQDFGAVRYGGLLTSNVFYRLYVQRFDRENTFLTNGNSAKDDWNMNLGGLRLDGYPTGDDQWTVEGNFYGGEENIPLATTTTVDGQNLLGRWTHQFSDESDFSIQAYFDRTWRKVPNSFSEDLKTYDLDFSHRFPLGERQSITWGAGYRFMQDHVQNGSVTFLPAHRDMHLYSGFLQDEIAIVPDKLKFAIGSKLEHNSFSGWEVQPSTRLGWSITRNQFAWAAISRAVRSPSRIDSDISVSNATLTLQPNSNFDSEKLLAYELGYRGHLHRRLTVSVSGYYNVYDDLRSLDALSANEVMLANHFEGETWGVELGINFQAADWWRLRAGYNYLHKDLDPTSPIAAPSVREGNDPANQFSLQSIMDLPANFQFDLTARYVDTLSQSTATSAAVPDYFTFDVRLAWQYKNWEFAVVGQNLWEHQHQEFGTQEIPRSVYGKITFEW